MPDQPHPAQHDEPRQALSAPAGSLFYFEDRNGREICFKGSTTIEDLVKHGVDRIAFVRPETTLRPNEWRHNGKVKENDKMDNGE